MKAYHIIIITLTAVIVLTASLIIVSRRHMELNRQHTVLLERHQRQQQTIAFLQQDDIQRLIAHVEKVMAGEIIYERGTNPLYIYSFSRDSYPTMASLSAHLQIVDINLDGDSGKILSAHSIIYRDSSGRVIMSTSACQNLPDIWILERQGEGWVIVEIDGGKPAWR